MGKTEIVSRGVGKTVMARLVTKSIALGGREEMR